MSHDGGFDLVGMHDRRWNLSLRLIGALVYATTGEGIGTTAWYARTGLTLTRCQG